MTSYQEVKDFILTTDANTRKNYQTSTFAFNSPSVVVANNTFVTRSFAVPLSTVTRDFEILLNMSDESDFYYNPDRFGRLEPVGTGQKQWATQITANGSTCNVVVYLVNTGIGSNVTFAAFTLNVIRRDFVDEF